MSMTGTKANPSETKGAKEITSRGIASLGDMKKSTIKKRMSSADAKRKSSTGKRKSYREPLPCALFRTRDEAEHEVHNDMEDPKAPFHYKPPFRRNFRYFGYPRDLNPDLNTPPRVRSWGPMPEPLPRRKAARTPFCCRLEGGIDPFWPGRLLKNCTMLENPTLVPVMGKAVSNLGRKPAPLVKPDLELTNCVSQLYFPLAESSRKAFCRINKIVKDDMAKQVHDFAIQNPTSQKRSVSEKEVRRSELRRKSKGTMLEAQRAKRESRFELVDLERKAAEILYYERNAVPETLKLFCVPDAYPGKNQQLYERPTEKDQEEVKLSTTDENLHQINDDAAYHQFHVPEDLWEKLAKVRARKQHLEKVRQNKGKEKSYKTFTQLELRNEVLREAKRNFLDSLNRNVNTTLPPELFEDNRGTVQPVHDYMENDELPPQGPFWWKTEREHEPTVEERIIVEAYIETLKDHHNFTHHLPGLLYMSRHPFPHIELDWLEKGEEMGSVGDKRKTPPTMHEMPYYVAQLEDEQFDQVFELMLKEKAKDLVGPEIYEQYRKMKGIKTPTISETQLEVDEGLEEKKDLKKKIRIRRPKPKEVEVEKEEHPKEDEAKEEEHEEEENEEDDLIEAKKPSRVDTPEELKVYNLTADLENEEEFPLPDIRFSQVDLRSDDIPEGLTKEEEKIFKRAMETLEFAEPVRLDEVEPIGSDESDSTTDSELLNDEQTEVSRDPTEHVQAMYQEAIRAKYRSTFHHISEKELKPPELKDVFLEDAYIEDIDNILHPNPNIPAFMQLF